jgi:hypothetical protein
MTELYYLRLQCDFCLNVSPEIYEYAESPHGWVTHEYIDDQGKDILDFCCDDHKKKWIAENVNSSA